MARTIPTNTDKLQAELDHLTLRGKRVRALVNSAEARRTERAKDQIDVSADDIEDGTDGKIRCTVWSSEGDRQYSVVITPVCHPTDRFDWRWSCTCDDARKASRHGHGPCKHTIEVASVWLEEQARPMYRFLKSLLDAEQGKDSEPVPTPHTPPAVAELVEAEQEAGPVDGDAYEPQPGTWAHTARLMAGPNPTPEEAEFWDNWKDEMKERDCW